MTTPADDVGELYVSRRAVLALKRAGYHTVTAVLEAAEDALTAIGGVGRKLAAEIDGALALWRVEHMAPESSDPSERAADAASARRVITVLRQERFARDGRSLGRAWEKIADCVQRDFPAPRSTGQRRAAPR